MCVSPLKAFAVGVTPLGKTDYKITSLKVHHLEVFKGEYRKIYDNKVSPYAQKVIRESIEIPCGDCVECKLAYSRMWADRIMLEAKSWNDSYFLTLTYNNEHLPFTYDGLMTLQPKDLQDFIKRLRRHKEPDIIRFFACGEYGDQSNRPHYHGIFFNLKIDDLEYYGQSNGNPIFISDDISKIWKHGHVIIAPLNWSTAAYTARYCMKKVHGKNKQYYEAVGIEPEFLRMSRRPGIAAQYFEQHYKKIYINDELILSDDSGGRRTKPPRYFDKKLEEVNEAWYKLIKERRRYVAEENKKTMCLIHNLPYEKILENRKLKMEQKTLALFRQL